MTRPEHATTRVRDYMQGTEGWVTSMEVYEGVVQGEHRRRLHSSQEVRRALNWLAAQGLVQRNRNGSTEVFRWKPQGPDSEG